MNNHITNKWTLYTDGASRNNPGLSGAGIYIEKNNKNFFKASCYLHTKTNNQAEYLALLLGLLYLKSYINAQDKVSIKIDSLLLVKQVLGEYKIKNLELKKLYNKVIQELKDIDYTIEHILRDKNKVADKLANEAIDKKAAIPEKFSSICNLISS